MKMTKYYLAYGSNLNVSQMERRCPAARVAGVAEIKGYELLFKGSKSGSYLTIEKCKGGVVPVAVWSVNEEDEAALDRYEGFPDFYYKKEFRIKMKGGKEKAVKAFAYIMHEDRPFGIPTLFYMNICRNGYDSFKFNQKYLIDAYEKSREEILK